MRMQPRTKSIALGILSVGLALSLGGCDVPVETPHCYVLPGNDPLVDAGKMRNSRSSTDRIVVCLKPQVSQVVVQRGRTVIEGTENEHGNGDGDDDHDHAEPKVLPQGSFANANTDDSNHGAWAFEGAEYSAIVDGKPFTFDPRDESVAE